MDGKNRERIERLRNAAVEPYISCDEFYFNFYRRYAENEQLGVREKRYADAYRYAHEHTTPYIAEDAI